MKKKKYTKTIIMIVVMATLGIAYYYYLANRTPSQDATQKAVEDQMLASLTTRDILANYPESPREIIKLYASITMAYYQTNTTKEQVKVLGKQARLLFDDELKEKQTDEEFQEALLQDVSSYNSMKRYISEFKLEPSNSLKYTTLNGRQYASINLVYYIRQKGQQLQYSYTHFVLRRDEERRWKILYWELTSSEEIDQ